MFDTRIVSDKSPDDIHVILHPGTHFNHPRDVLADRTLPRPEKRAILASWASDAAAVMSCPALRAIPGSKRVVSIDKLLEVLANLNRDPPDPPGGHTMRLKTTDRALAA